MSGHDDIAEARCRWREQFKSRVRDMERLLARSAEATEPTPSVDERELMSTETI